LMVSIYNSASGSNDVPCRTSEYSVSQNNTPAGETL
jgi:hypothetical protein